MKALRRPGNDPRTLARDIPGFFDALFPQLVPGVVAYLNRRSLKSLKVEPVSEETVAASKLQHAMLFEVAVAAAEQLIDQQSDVDWSRCLIVAGERQRKHFDAKIPAGLDDVDKEIALHVAMNLRTMLLDIRTGAGDAPLITSPRIPGYQWIASSTGDFAVGTSLIEVKCTNKHFSSSDYRQITIYWLLSYLAAIEQDAVEWSEGVLLNPRLNLVVKFSFQELIEVIAGEQSKVELVEAFSTMVESRKFNQVNW